MKKFLTKFILVSLVVSFAATPFYAMAQLSLGSVPVLLNGESPLGTFTGTAAGVAVDVIAKSASTCVTSDTITSQVASTLTQGLSLLGDSPAQAAGIQAQITIVDGALVCWTGVLTSVTALGSGAGGGLFIFTKMNAIKDQSISQIASLKAIRKQLEARLQVASQSFWKAVLIGLFLKQTDQLTEKLVTDMTEKFKINDYSQYVGAVADTVYTNSMILRYVDNDKDRAIVRSMIMNPTLRNKIHPAVQSAADAYVGFDVDNLSFSDPQYYTAINKIANGEVYKQQYQSAMLSKTDEVIAKAREAAVAEVGQSGGYKSTLNNCGPSISEQKRKDAEYKAILDEIKDRETLHESIHAAAGATNEEKTQIKADVKTARTKLEKFTDSFGKAVVHICEGTNTPAVKFKDTIHDLIGSQIKNFTDYNDNNLPLFQRLIVDLADNLVNKFVFGKNSASTGDLVKESTNSILAGVAGSISKPSSTLPGATPPFVPTGLVKGQVTNTSSVEIMPRGPNISFR